MKPGDLLRLIPLKQWGNEYIPTVYINTSNDELHVGFTPDMNEIGILINLCDLGGCAKILLRGTIVYISHRCIEVIR